MKERQLLVWKLILESLNQNIAVMLLYVMESSGSSPGRQGFFMAVNAVGEMQGSVGGGIMEHKFVEMAKGKLSNNEDELSVRKQIHDKSAAKNQSGMICSGEQTILLYRVHKEEKNYIENIIDCLEKNKNALLRLSPAGLLCIDKVPCHDFIYSYQSDENWWYEEKIGHKNKLHIIGAGHCALAFSRIMQMMDFYITLYDDRQNLHTLLQNEYVHNKILLANYRELNEHITSGANEYVVIMTMGYRTDDVAVRTLMDKQFAYLGVLGSKKKLQKMFSTYAKEGIAEEVLKRIHAPVGLPIHSQTPEEIAVSIAAEMISVKNLTKKTVHVPQEKGS